MKKYKGYCLHCATDNEKLRIFDVNPDVNVCYCPNCMKAIEPKEAIKIFEQMMEHHIRDCYYFLYVTGEYLKAYQSFGNVVDLDPYGYKARQGRLLSLLYISTLRCSRFKQYLELLNEEAPLYFRGNDKTNSYLFFIKTSNEILKEYETYLIKRLTHKNVFYDNKCIMLYFKRLDEILKIRQFFVNELKRSMFKNNAFVNELIEEIHNLIVSVEKTMEQPQLSFDLYHYSFIGFSNNEVLLSKNENQSNSKHTLGPIKSLNTNQKSSQYISEIMYRTKVGMKSYRGPLLLGYILSLSLSACFLIASLFVYFYVNQFFYLSLILAGIFLVIGLGLLFANIIRNKVHLNRRINKLQRKFVDF